MPNRSVSGNGRGRNQAMMRTSLHDSRFSVRMAAISLVTGALVLGGCGPVGDDEEPTDDAPQMTIEATRGPAMATPDATSFVQAPSTPDSDDVEGLEAGTPEDEPRNPETRPTPDSPPPLGGRTPVPGQVRPAPSDDDPDSTPDADETAPASNAAGDGTTGATPSADDPSNEDASPEEVTTAEAVTVDSCEPDDVPDFTGDSAEFLVVENLNFRTGPGSDCDLIGDSVLESGAEIVVTSDPVLRDGEETEWVRVEVEGEEGWVAAEFIEPVTE